MTMWKDEIKQEGELFVYESRPRLIEKKRAGATERLENLIWARDHCDGLVRTVIATAKDLNAEPRKSIDWFSDDQLIMRITYLDEKTGAFRAESVSK